MPLHPRSAYDNFAQVLAHFCVASDAEIEDQFFDRKDVPRSSAGSNVPKSVMDSLKEAMRETISAFANSNPEGGLLVLGISKTGTVHGVNHLTEAQRLDLTNVGHLLRSQSALVKLVDCVDCDGQPNRLILVYAPETTDAVCETLDGTPRAWKRAGPQNLPLADRDREQLLRDKRIVAFERRIAGPYDPGDLDQALLTEIRRTWPELDGVTRPDAELLYDFGALDRTADGYTFTNAGLLFFGSNPQRILPAAKIRVLRYDANRADASPGDPTLDRTFSGSLTHQLLEVREFLRSSGLLRVYQVRQPDGGFAEEAEIPYIAIDEAIVNAVAHRDYALEWQIECAYYRDAFVVRNPGKLLQRSGTVPAHFSLDRQTLQHMPRNPKLLEWLKQARDQKGQRFVRALSEGTRTMLREMESAKLPAPVYDASPTETIVTLLSDPTRYIRKLEKSTEFTNLYRLHAEGKLPDDWKHAVISTLADRLSAAGWFIDRVVKGRLIAHERGADFAVPQGVRDVVRLFPAFSFTVRHARGRHYLVIDYTVEVKNVLTASQLAARNYTRALSGRWAVAKGASGWAEVRIETVGHASVEVRSPVTGAVEHVAPSAVIPNLTTSEIAGLLPEPRFDLFTEIKRRSLATITGAARRRAEQVQLTASFLAEKLFPIRVGSLEVTLISEHLRLGNGGLVARTLPEPAVEFGRQKETSNIREGITAFGAYEAPDREVELVPIVSPDQHERMAALIERLKTGKFKYRGSERTFGTRFTYASIVTTPPDKTVATCMRLLDEHLTWAGDANLRRLFLVHTPEAHFASDDETSPYFTTKRFLLERGVPCQMLDTPTLLNPDFKDLNLALNITAKCGVVPWVLHEGIADADFFVGLSYTQHRGDPTARLMGYANVFNQYGRWLFYSGNAQTFPYEERTKRLAELVEGTLKRLELSGTPHVYFHYSAKFSRDDRAEILRAARRVRPEGTYSFVWVNTHHPIRLYDERPESDGSLARGAYVATGDNQFYLSTTGYNPYRKMLGTPIPLEVTVWKDGPREQARTPPDLHALARQILALTKLNWSSSDALAGEPITTKYAGDIAYLTAAFLRQRSPFTLHPTLEKTPWFL